ncbi:MAG: nickel-dependent lactate racemase [Candidatus Aenigmatarchaeota archaeon]
MGSNHIKIKYGYDFIKINLPSQIDFYEAKMKDFENIKNIEKVLQEKLREPIGTSSLNEIISSNSKIVILVDDYTRATPAYKILPILINEIKKKNVKKENIEIMFALGTHRKPTMEEIIGKIGEKIYKEYLVSYHDFRDYKNLKYLGKTKLGTPVYINEKALQADLLIGIGMIAPHRVCGFSGGSSIIQPGISGEETTFYTHWLSAQYSGIEILGKIDNPVKNEMNEVASKTNLKFIINVVLNKNNEIVEIFVGDFIKAWRIGAEFSSKVYGVKIPFQADIVIADCPPPSDINMWQASKSIYASELVIKPGGTIILLARCFEGISKEHPEVEKFGYMGFKQVKELVNEGKIKDLTAAAHIAHVGRIIKDKAECILISSGIKKEIAEKIGFKYEENPQKAILKALDKYSKEAKIVILHNAPTILPIL